MARNDILLIDSLIQKSRFQLGEEREDSEIFELYCFNQILKDHDLSFEEIETGWTDGPEDGGIDGFYIFVDGHLITDKDLSFVSKRNPNIVLELFTIKSSNSFKQGPLNSLYNSLNELFDLTIDTDELEYPFRSDLVEQRKLLKETLVSVADRRPELTININYCSRGDTKKIGKNLTSRAKQIEGVVKEFFSSVKVRVQFFGASEILEISRREQKYSLNLNFLESYISREKGNYIILAGLKSYYNFITDDAGSLRRYLFESNVRDFLGPVRINEDIRSTLEAKKSATEEDFWWLNNGVTILATHANVIGKEIILENVQIVNGLQTTETIYNYFKDNSEFDDDRAVLIKVLLSTDEQTRARIIKATNYQNTVNLSSIRGLDKIQRDIEQFLLDNNWFYDRRKNYYKNQGKPASKIISIQYLAAAIRAVALGDPSRSRRQRSKSLRDDKVYKQVFNSNWDLNVYLVSLEITHAVELSIQKRRKLTLTPPIALVNYLSFILTADKLGTNNYAPSDIIELKGYHPTSEEIENLRYELEIASKKFKGKGKKYRGIKINKMFFKKFIDSRFDNNKK